MPSDQETTQWLPLKKLVYDPVINTRPLSPTTVKRLVADFDPEFLGVIHVAPRSDGNFAIIDGHHRVTAAKQALGLDQKVECKVHRRIRTAKQAALFVGLNNSKKVGPLYDFIARLNSNEPVAKTIEGIVEEHGLRIEASPAEGVIRCVAALQTVYWGGVRNGKTLNPESHPKALSETVRVITSAWGTGPAAVNGQLLEGVGLVILRYGDRLDIDRLISRLASYPGGAGGLLGHARGLRDLRGGQIGRAAAAAIVTAYNKGTRSGKLEEWWS